MPESPMVGAKILQDWQQQLQEIATAAGRKEAEVVREALAQYLGRTDPAASKVRTKALRIGWRLRAEVGRVGMYLLMNICCCNKKP